MERHERQKSVLELLQSLTSTEQLKQLFWTQLNYERINQPLPTTRWKADTAKVLAEDPVLFAGGGGQNDFHIIYARLASDKLILGQQRSVINQLLNYHPYALFIFSNRRQDRWHFVNIKYDEKTEKRRLFRRITVGPEERLRTASERISMLDLETIPRDLFGLTPLQIQARHDEAFDVEKVTKVFFDEYKTVFKDLENDIKRHHPIAFAHDYALQFLNRCMFLYFIQRKGWLGGDTDFLRTFWETYCETKQPNDTFVEKWLKVLFFEAFNNKFHGGHRQFPDAIRSVLAHAPFLNGGLFSENELDKKLTAPISDKRFEQIFTFLERYNFTIAEDSPLDQEVAVDPEMIGKVYESLVNVSEEADERGDAGIFYTPRTEIDLMCRLALADNLTNHLGGNNKSLLNQFVFSLEPDEKKEADAAITKAKLWPALDARLKEVAIVDPACGSGSFLVGMLHILNDLQERTGGQLGNQESVYDRKKRIIGQSLYGVDIMDWACHVAELRLWLALIIDAEFAPEDLHVRKKPLLPHFSFKVRCGDSLVQEVGGINFGHIRHSLAVSSQLKTRITKLKNEKIKFYNNDPDRQFKTEEQITHEELRLFREILDDRAQQINAKIKVARSKIEGPKSYQIRIDGTVERKAHQMELQAAVLQKDIDNLKTELQRVEEARAALKTVNDVPFIWDIAFVEIFEDEKEGFDIVIGNPPYVRQENIADPQIPKGDITAENKRSYKTKLARSVYQKFPQFFGYKESKDTNTHRLDAKSDLYIYFYFHGLSLLNPNGSFCFITSNSWLDVGYGKDLQEFLLKHCHVKMVLDNQVKRSFASADVNTVIALFSAPDERRDWALDKTARFVMFKVPFEHILSPVIFDEIESSRDRSKTHEYRIYPIAQKQLLQDGWEWPEDATEEEIKRFGFNLKGSKYGGNKWGGKYLRAPDIYWTILEKGKGKLVRLGDIAEVRFGIKTGCNEFFYLDDEKIKAWGIEKEFLKPFLFSFKEVSKYEVDPSSLKRKIFVCRDIKTELKKKSKEGALSYIYWGEKQKYNQRPSVQGRPNWYALPEQNSLHFVSNRFFGERFGFPWIEDILVCDVFFVGRFYNDNGLVCTALLNSVISFLSAEVLARKTYGIGIAYLYGPEINAVDILSPTFVNKKIGNDLITFFNLMRNRNLLRLDEEFQQLDRRALDNIIFDILGLTQGERDAVYEAVISLVNARLKKAESLNPKAQRQQLPNNDNE